MNFPGSRQRGSGADSGLTLGVTLGTVSDTKDPDGLGRVKLKLKLKGSEIETTWAQIASLLAGPNMGAFFLPQVNDSALVAFANGDPSQPFVLGFLWNGAQKPPLPPEQQQDVRLIKTGKGKTFSLDDSAKGRISLVDEKKNELLINTAENLIALSSEGDLTITAKGKLSITAASISLQNTAGSVKVTLSEAALQLDGSQSLKLQATMIDLN